MHITIEKPIRLQNIPNPASPPKISEINDPPIINAQIQITLLNDILSSFFVAKNNL